MPKPCVICKKNANQSYTDMIRGIRSCKKHWEYVYSAYVWIAYGEKQNKETYLSLIKSHKDFKAKA